MLVIDKAESFFFCLSFKHILFVNGISLSPINSIVFYNFRNLNFHFRGCSQNAHQKHIWFGAFHRKCFCQSNAIGQSRIDGTIEQQNYITLACWQLHTLLTWSTYQYWIPMGIFTYVVCASFALFLERACDWHLHTHKYQIKLIRTSMLRCAITSNCHQHLIVCHNFWAK